VHELENIVVGCIVSQDQLKHVGNILVVIAVSQLETGDSALIICTEEEIILTTEDIARFSILIIFLSMVDSE
jgi:serine/threonine protein phosphatase PrpC